MTSQPAGQERFVSVEGVVIQFRLVRSPDRRRTIGMRVLPDRTLVVRAPLKLSSREVDDFVRSRAEWIAAALAAPVRAAPATSLGDGDTVPFRGAGLELRVELGGRRVVAEREGVLHVTLPAASAASPGAIERAVERWLRARALEAITAAAAQWSASLDAIPDSVLLSNARHRWGSCGIDGVVRVNWRVIMVAPELLEYVVVHELCHLLEHNHSRRFWAHVAAALPDHRQRRAALRAADSLLRTS